MADTQYKSVDLRELFPKAPALGPTAPNTLMRWEALRTVLQAQDTAVAGSRRIVAWSGMNGHTGFLTPNSSTAPADEVAASPSTPTFPIVSQWRTQGEFLVRVTPGCTLRSAILYVPSGFTHSDGPGTNWLVAGGFGMVRARVTWDGDVSAGPSQYSTILPPSPLEYAQEPDGFGGFWSYLALAEIVDIMPASFDANLATAEDHSDLVEATILHQIRGGVRVVCWVTYEEPRAHVVSHNDAGPHAVHHGTGFGTAQTTVPQTEVADGTTYDDDRFGTTRVLNVADRQDQVLGPRIAEWSSWDETDSTNLSDNPPSDPLQQQPVSTSSTTAVGICDANTTEWGTDEPGFAVAGSHALRHHRNDSGLIMRNGDRGVVPVRVWCRGRWTDTSGSSMGVARFQSGPFEWIDLEFTDDGNVEELTAYGYMQSQVVPEDVRGNLVPLMWVDAGTGTLEIWEWSVDFYEAG